MTPVTDVSSPTPWQPPPPQRFQPACLLRSNTGSAAQRHFLWPTVHVSTEHWGQRLEGVVVMVGGDTHSTSHLRFIRTLSITLAVWTVSSWIKVTEKSSFTLSTFNQQLAASWKCSHNDNHRCPFTLWRQKSKHCATTKWWRSKMEKIFFIHVSSKIIKWWLVFHKLLWYSNERWRKWRSYLQEVQLTEECLPRGSTHHCRTQESGSEEPEEKVSSMGQKHTLISTDFFLLKRQQKSNQSSSCHP